MKVIMDHLKITSDLLSADEVCSLVKDESCGAVSLFIGTTRDNFDGKKVLQLEYEAYEGMAIKSMKAICNEIRSKWSDVHGIAIYHRTGVVPVKEASVIIAVSSPHRQASLEAVAFCIDQLKATVPIWKKEIYEGEDRGVKEMDDKEMKDISVGDSDKNSDENECHRQTVDNNLAENRPAIDEKRNIDKSMIQVNVTCEELERRMNNFINRKREQVNMHNIEDFIPNRREDDVESCARVRTLFVKRSDSKGHLKVRRVYNEWGPQTAKHNVKHIKTEPETFDATLPIGVAERVASIEKYLNVTPVSSDIYKRLKAMEERIADLESLSPEYANFWKYASPNEEVVHREHKELIYDADDIDQKIEELERELM